MSLQTTEVIRLAEAYIAIHHESENNWYCISKKPSTTIEEAAEIAQKFAEERHIQYKGLWEVTYPIMSTIKHPENSLWYPCEFHKEKIARLDSCNLPGIPHAIDLGVDNVEFATLLCIKIAFDRALIFAPQIGIAYSEVP